MAQSVKNLPVLRRPRFDPGMGKSPREGNGNLLQYSCLENPMDRGAWQAAVHWAAKNPPANAGDTRRRMFESWVGKTPWSRKWQSTPVFLLGKFHGQRSLVGYSLWGHKESGLTEHMHTHTHTHTRIIITYTLDIVALQSPNHVRLLATPCIAACQASLSLLISWDLPKFMFIELVMPSKHLILCLLLPSVFLSSGYFPMSQLFVSGDQSIGASDSALVLPVSIQG